MNDLLIKDCEADIVLTIVVLTEDKTERSVSVLLDSNDDWSSLTYSDDLLDTFGFFGRALLKDIIEDPKAIGFRVQKFQIINGQSVDVMTTRPFYRDGDRFRCANVDKKGNVTFLPEDRI